VGVVSDYRPLGVENGARPQIFRPSLSLGFASLIVRTGASQKSVEGLLRDTVHQLDPELAVDQVRSMDEYLDGWQAQRRFNTLLLVFFAVLALVLALIGIYGVLSNLVAARVREIGIRVAIGARPSQIAKLVIRQTMVPVLAGVIIGLAGSLMLSRYLGSLLFQVDPRDPLTLVSAACALILVSPVAVYLPLRRALSVDCTVALRNE
jgi:putative ABC transport system permease protein